MKGSVYKRCGCPPELDARGRRRACRLPHGSWCFVADVPVDGTARRRQVKRSGFATRALAEQALTAHLEQAARGPAAHDGGQRVGAYLDAWLEAKAASGLRDTTLHTYRMHVERFLKPQLGHLRLRELHPTHVEGLLVAVARPVEGRKPLGPASVRRVHATLRSALASAKRKRLIPYNPAVDLDLPRVSRPKVRPWQAAELGRFLDATTGDRLGPLFELMAATGLRRGEALGLRWEDVDLDRSDLVVRRQLLQVVDAQARRPCPYCEATHKQVVFGRPKTASGEDRLVELDSGTVRVLHAHRAAQDAERAAWGRAYVDHGLVFAREDGSPISPDVVSKRFQDISESAGLPRVRLHDLRHGAASLRLAAGVDIAVVSKQLGHSTITLTSDTYSHLLHDVGRQAAERAMALVPRDHRDQVRDQSVTSRPVDHGAEEALNALTWGDGAPPSGLEPETLRLTVACSAN